MARCGPRLLVVDDDPNTLSTYCAILSLAGFDVVAASSGHQGLDLLRGGHFDLLLTDLRMPDISGLELVAAAHEHAPGLPVVVFSCFGSAASEWAARQLGATGFISKSWDQEQFVELIRRHACGTVMQPPECRWQDQTVGHATRRWVSIVTAVICASEDLPTTNDWADELHKSVSTLKRWCNDCGVHAADSLDFARALRVVRLHSGRRVDWYDRLAIVDQKTMSAFLKRAGFSFAAAVPGLGQFLPNQRFIASTVLVNAIAAAL
jgi:DNA-binding NarL/FixJ family response regulator